MNESMCSSYARLARSLMEIYRHIPDGEILSMSAGVTCGDPGAVEIHRAIAEHRALCEICKENIKADRRIRPMKRQAVFRANTRRP